MLKSIKNIFTRKVSDDLNLTDHLWVMFHDGNYDEVIVEAQKFLSHKSCVIAKDAYNLTSMCFYRQNKYEEALFYFQKTVEFDATVNDWFNVVLSGTFARQFAVAESAFRQAIQLQKERDHSEKPNIPFMYLYHTYALRDVGEYALALENIDVLRQIYEQTKITDPTFLYARDLPTLSHAMDVTVGVFRGLGDSFNASEWFDSFATKLDEHGREYVNQVKAEFIH